MLKAIMLILALGLSAVALFFLAGFTSGTVFDTSWVFWLVVAGVVAISIGIGAFIRLVFDSSDNPQYIATHAQLD